MARPSAEQMFKNMIGRQTHEEAEVEQTVEKIQVVQPAEVKKKSVTVQVTVRLRPEQHKQLKAAAFHRECDMSELVRQALDQFFS